MITPVHRWPHEIHKACINHGERRTGTFFVRARALHIGYPRDEGATGSDVVTARLDLESQLASGGGAKPLVTGVEEFVQWLNRHLRAMLAIVMRNAAAETHRG